MGWDVEIENLKLIVIAPEVDFKNRSLNIDIVESIKVLAVR